MLERGKYSARRGIVSLIAAYAIVLQAFFAFSVASEAAASGNQSGTFFVFCSASAQSASLDQSGTPTKTITHCPICTLTVSSGAAVPDSVVVPHWQPTFAHEILIVTSTIRISIYQSHVGLARAPPQHA